jgi:hypothetical protein
MGAKAGTGESPRGLSTNRRRLKGLALAVSATTVRAWLRHASLGPIGTRGGMSWRTFLRTDGCTMLAADFFTVETAFPPLGYLSLPGVPNPLSPFHMWTGG